VEGKRFWKNATVTDASSGWQVLLDGRPIRTPSKSPMDLPTEEMAHAIAGEWAEQTEDIDPLVDACHPLGEFGHRPCRNAAWRSGRHAGRLCRNRPSQPSCRRTGQPACEQQDDGWDPLLDWAEERFGARLLVTSGILPIEQPKPALQRLSEVCTERTPSA
jgi:chaperone required for assembly of F1-ATPase